MSSPSNNDFRQLTNDRIRHTVILKFKENVTFSDQKVFFDEVRKLKAIKEVEQFEILKQTSIKNKFEFGISMEFSSLMAYETYNNHPDHVAFVQNIWLKQVDDFLEIDYEVFR